MMLWSWFAVYDIVYDLFRFHVVFRHEYTIAFVLAGSLNALSPCYD